MINATVVCKFDASFPKSIWPHRADSHTELLLTLLRVEEMSCLKFCTRAILFYKCYILLLSTSRFYSLHENLSPGTKVKLTETWNESPILRRSSLCPYVFEPKDQFQNAFRKKTRHDEQPRNTAANASAVQYFVVHFCRSSNMVNRDVQTLAHMARISYLFDVAAYFPLDG